jgi:PIN domain nuclease of toxin-antitoxin system
MKIQQAVAVLLDTYTFTGYVASNKKGSISMKNVVGAKKADAACVEVMMWDFGKPQWE